MVGRAGVVGPGVPLVQNGCIHWNGFEVAIRTYTFVIRNHVSPNKVAWWIWYQTCNCGQSMYILSHSFCNHVFMFAMHGTEIIALGAMAIHQLYKSFCGENSAMVGWVLQ